MSMKYEPLRLPFDIKEINENTALALNRNFSAIERALSRIQVYENNYGIPVNLDGSGSSATDIIVRYGEKKVFKQQTSPTIGLGVDEAREFDLWLYDDLGTPVWKQLRKGSEGLEWITVANRSTHPAEYDIITTVGLDAAVITTGLLAASRIEVGSGTSFDTGYDPSTKRRVFTDAPPATPAPPYDVGDLWAQGEGNFMLVCVLAKASGGAYHVDDWAISGQQGLSAYGMELVADYRAFKYDGNSVGVGHTDIIITAQTTNLTNITYEWYDDGALMVGETLSSLTIARGAYTIGTKRYTCIVDAEANGAPVELTDYMTILRVKDGAVGEAGTGLNFRGQWDIAADYVEGDYVFDESSTDPLADSMYICILAILGNPLNDPPKDDAVSWVEFYVPYGEDGEDAKGLRLLSSAMAFRYGDDDQIVEPDSITLVAWAQNLDPVTTYTWTCAATLTGAGNTRYLSKANFDAAGVKGLEVKVSRDGLEDTITIWKLMDASGYTVIGTNENHTFTAHPEGELLTIRGSDCELEVYKGVIRFDYLDHLFFTFDGSLSSYDRRGEEFEFVRESEAYGSGGESYGPSVPVYEDLGFVPEVDLLEDFTYEVTDISVGGGISVDSEIIGNQFHLQPQSWGDFENPLFTFNQTLNSYDKTEQFELVREHEAYDSSGEYYASNLPVYEDVGDEAIDSATVTLTIDAKYREQTTTLTKVISYTRSRQSYATYSAVLTNEHINLVANQEGSVPSYENAYTYLIAWKGNERITNQCTMEVHDTSDPSIEYVYSWSSEEGWGLYIIGMDAGLLEGSLDIYIKYYGDVIAKRTLYFTKQIGNLGRSLFVGFPFTPYRVDDIWLDNSGTVWRCTIARATGDYVAGDWTAAGVSERLFTGSSNPSPPYDKGDIWHKEISGFYEVWICIVDKASGSYVAGDWIRVDHRNLTKTVIDGGLVTTGTIELKGAGGDTLVGMTGALSGSAATRIWAGSIFANRATAPFRVTQGGSLYSTAGYIAGWEITALGLKLGTSTNTRGISTGNVAFYAGDADPLAAPFKVARDGEFKAQKGTLRSLSLGTPGVAGLWIGDTQMGYYDGGLWKTYMDNTGKFFLGGVSGSLQWDGTTLTITGSGTFTGTITANAGRIGGPTGWVIDSLRMYSNDIELQVGVGTAGYIRNTSDRWRLNNDGSGSLAQGTISWTSAGVATFSGGFLGGTNRVQIDASGLDVGTSGMIRGGATSYSSGTGFWMGYSGGAYQFRIGTTGGNRISWDGSLLTVRGHLVADSGTFYGTVYASAGWFQGAVYATSGYFYGEIHASSGSFTGSLNAVSGTYSWLQAGSGGDYVYLNSNGVYGYSGGNLYTYLSRTSLWIRGGHNVYGNNLYLYLQSSHHWLASTPGGSLFIWNTGAAQFSGHLSKGSGSFLIAHPLESKKETHKLIHGFVEAPRYDLLYRGVTRLTKGRAKVSIDLESNMTPGTFKALTQNAVVVGLCNQDGYARTRAGKIVNGEFEIYCEAEVNDKIAWMVVAERADDFIKNKDPYVDDQGKLTPEVLITEEDREMEVQIAESREKSKEMSKKALLLSQEVSQERGH